MHEIQAAYLRKLASVGESRKVAGALAVRTGIASNTENGVVSTAAELDGRVVADLLHWLRGIPASWIALDPAIGPALLAAGCTPEENAWNMSAEITRVAEPLHPVWTVDSDVDLDMWLGIVRECGWFDEVGPARRVYRAMRYDGLYLSEGGAASAFFTPPTVLLNAVAVLPRLRRRGIGRALALARLRDAKARSCTTAILAPSPDGRKLYESLGFHPEVQPRRHWFYLPHPERS
jgi:GNAT superfamily N-acetyltransferase